MVACGVGDLTVWLGGPGVRDPPGWWRRARRARVLALDVVVRDPRIAVQVQQRGGKLLASGGGGGEGGGPSGAGVPGGEAEGPGQSAAGGRVAANDESGDGADGSTGPMLDGGDAVDGVCETVPSCGGGGGGGGGAAGFIYAPVFSGSQIDPPPANP